LEKVILGDGGNGIEANNQPFTYFLNLKEVIFPKSLSTIPDYSFFKLQSLEKVTIPYGVTDLTIGERAFYESNLASLTIPDSVTNLKIGIAAFQNSSLTSLTIPDSVTNLEIGNGAFSDSNLASLTIPYGVTNLTGDGVFYLCTNLTSLTIPNSVTDLTIGFMAFESCTSLASLTIPDSVTKLTIGVQAFKDCTSLTSLTIPDSVTNLGIGNDAFAGCTKLTSLTIPDRATKAITNAFDNSILKLVTTSDTANSTLKVLHYNGGLNMINSILEAAPPISDINYTFDLSSSSISPAITSGNLTTNNPNTRWRVKLNDGKEYKWNGSSWEQI
jgi:hypothetical protein